MPDLSVVIPSRNEMWLKNTVDDVLAASKADTEVIVVADGAWPVEGLPQHPRLSLVYLPEARGQRAATNLGARLARAPFVMKLDAHCRVAPGFDVELLKTQMNLGCDVVQIPAQYNLHVFDWVCVACGDRRYQGPTPTSCPKCPGTEFRREMVWQPRKSRRTEFWRFDRNLHFQYWGAYKHRPEAQGEIAETMSCLGACWVVDKAWFWGRLGGLDEGHGGWGQMGTELACKAWLSGGRMVVNKRTWFAHLFRTQGGDFGFPYPLSQRDVEKARAHSRHLWMGHNWEHQVRRLEWLIEKFKPVPGWEDQKKAIVYYTDNRLDPQIESAARRTLADTGLPIFSVSLKPIDFGTNIALSAERGYLTMFKQILCGISAAVASGAETVYLCEHDVLYHPSHFEFSPPARDVYYYNENVWKVDADSGRALFYRCRQTSGLCADAQLLLRHYRERVRRVEAEGFSRRMGFEPGTHRRAERVDDHRSEAWRSAAPNIDLRHEHNLTPTRWRREQFRDQRNCQEWTEADEVPGWGRTIGRMDRILG